MPKWNGPEIAGLRDKLIHQYFSVDWDIVWDVVQEQLPTLKGHVTALLPHEDPE